MQYYYDAIVQWIGRILNASWHWFNALDRGEWLIVLAVTTAAGFLCMRGYGSRTNY